MSFRAKELGARPVPSPRESVAKESVGAASASAPSVEADARIEGPAAVGASAPGDPGKAPPLAPAHVKSGAPTTNKQAGLYDAPLDDRRLPPLHEALGDPSIPPLSPGEAIDVPAEALQALQKARRVLVIGHVPPDGDCLGSALGLARALRALGKDAVACVDADLQGQLRGLPEGDAVRADGVEGPFDLVVLVDVAQGKRTGGAARHIAEAADVLVVDHHRTRAEPAEVGAAEGATITRFLQPGLEAASLQVAALVERLAAMSAGGIDDEAWSDISLPLCAGTLTDTDSFRLPGSSLDSLRMFKHLALRLADGGVDDVERTLRWELPAAAKERLQTASGEGDVHHVRFPQADVIAAPKQALDAAMAAGRREDPAVLDADVKGALLDRLDASVARNEVAILVAETEEGVQVSVRTRDADLAVQIVEETFPGDGGGKPHVAAARPAGNIEDVVARLSDWIEARAQAHQLRLRCR
jgi:nanoRNase/pAp phosphatase (c-di-AMP/oligoRNAs hydrolase)